MRAHLAGALVLLALAACDMPRPFAPDSPNEPRAAIDAVTLLGPRGSLMVSPVEGMDPEASRALSEGVAAELRKREVVAFNRSGGRASWLLQLAVAGPDRTRWRLVDPGGRIARTGVSAAQPGALAGQVETAVTELAPSVPVAQRQKVRLAGVAGVSADAERLLTQALRSELRRAGIPVVAAGDDALVLKGTVRRSDLGDEGEEIEIAWTMAQPDGEEIGTVGQSNRLPRGQLDLRWAAIAPLVAAGALDGLLDLVEAVESVRRKGG